MADATVGPDFDHALLVGHAQRARVCTPPGSASTTLRSTSPATRMVSPSGAQAAGSGRTGSRRRSGRAQRRQHGGDDDPACAAGIVLRCMEIRRRTRLPRGRLEGEKAGHAGRASEEPPRCRCAGRGPCGRLACGSAWHASRLPGRVTRGSTRRCASVGPLLAATEGRRTVERPGPAPGRCRGPAVRGLGAIERSDPADGAAACHQSEWTSRDSVATAASTRAENRRAFSPSSGAIGAPNSTAMGERRSLPPSRDSVPEPPGARVPDSGVLGSTWRVPWRYTGTTGRPVRRAR